MPRSGTSIVTSYLNSQEGAFVIGEPTWPQKAKKNQLVFSRYGDFVLDHQKDIFEQLESLATDFDLSMIGIKEAWVPSVNAIQIANKYHDIVDSIIITARDPRRTYLSMYNKFASLGPVSLPLFERHYKALLEYGKETEKARFIVLEQFRKDPVGILRKASGLDIKEVKELHRYTGGGCNVARESTAVIDKETCDQAEERFPSAELAYQFVLREVKQY
jgi:hypothetical protein